MATILPEIIEVSDLTAATTAGNGIFDVLVRANKAHLEEEFRAGRIKGPEYATVYLGALEATMQAAVQFTLQRQKVAKDAQLVDVQIGLVQQQTQNAILEGEVLKGQKCKLDAEFDVLQQTKLKVTQETALLQWKVTTEKAQTTAVGVDADSVVGRQKLLYQAQADGFKRDAEQKAAKIMVDSWNVRRTTDEGTVADGTNMLYDAAVGRAVTTLLAGVGA